MEWIKEIWNQISTILKWWIIILPWEAGLRIRMGKIVKILGPGIHFRVPYIDSCYSQSIRVCFINLAPQTLTTKTGETLTVSLIVGYSISDILKVYNAVSEIEGAISGKVSGSISEFISSRALSECLQVNIESHAKLSLETTAWGINIDEIKIVTYAVVRTFRFIQDHTWMSQSHKLDTKK